MKWKLSKVSSLAEIVAAFGVIISLVFVGMQVKDGNLETRAATIQAAAGAESFLNATFLSHADVWNKVATGAPFEDETEVRKAIILYNMLMIDTENRYHQFQSGFLDVGSWEGHRSNLQRSVKWPIFKIWRKSGGANGHSPEYLELLDSLAEDNQVE
jgi:hypothetical protein